MSTGRILSLVALGLATIGLVVVVVAVSALNDGETPVIRVTRTTTSTDPPTTDTSSDTASGTGTTAGSDPPAVVYAGHYEPRVLARFPHDQEAFTQGLEWFGDVLLESTGLRGRSTLRLVDPESGDALQRLNIDEELFGEGITVVDNRALQLTWTERVLLITDLPALAPESQERVLDAYEGEGWGLCYDGTQLVMSNGSAELAFRNPQSFELERRVTVTLDGAPIERLNELECVGGQVWANIWKTNTIIAVNPLTGDVAASVDASNLVPPGLVDAADDVLNGIAYRPESGTFWLTGKRWPVLYEVEFLPA